MSRFLLLVFLIALLGEGSLCAQEQSPEAQLAAWLALDGSERRQAAAAWTPVDEAAAQAMADAVVALLAQAEADTGLVMARTEIARRLTRHGSFKRGLRRHVGTIIEWTTRPVSMTMGAGERPLFVAIDDQLRNAAAASLLMGMGLDEAALLEPAALAMLDHAGRHAHSSMLHNALGQFLRDRQDWPATVHTRLEDLIRTGPASTSARFYWNLLEMRRSEALDGPLLVAALAGKERDRLTLSLLGPLSHFITPDDCKDDTLGPLLADLMADTGLGDRARMAIAIAGHGIFDDSEAVITSVYAAARPFLQRSFRKDLAEVGLAELLPTEDETAPDTPPAQTKKTPDQPPAQADVPIAPEPGTAAWHLDALTAIRDPFYRNHNTLLAAVPDDLVDPVVDGLVARYEAGFTVDDDQKSWRIWLLTSRTFAAIQQGDGRFRRSLDRHRERLQRAALGAIDPDDGFFLRSSKQDALNRRLYLLSVAAEVDRGVGQQILTEQIALDPDQGLPTEHAAYAARLGPWSDELNELWKASLTRQIDHLEDTSRLAMNLRIWYRGSEDQVAADAFIRPIAHAPGAPLVVIDAMVAEWVRRGPPLDVADTDLLFKRAPYLSLRGPAFNHFHEGLKAIDANRTETLLVAIIENPAADKGGRSRRLKLLQRLFPDDERHARLKALLVSEDKKP